MNYVSDIGKVLLDLCSIAKTNNVNIQIRQIEGKHAGDRTVFELRLNRDIFYSAHVVDVTPIYSRPAEALENAFNRAMYNLKYEINQKKQFSNGSDTND